MRGKITYPLFLLCLILLGGCATTRSVPQSPDNLCQIFLERPKWYEAALDAERRWKVKVPIIMAIMYHESGFRADARPPREKCLWILPGPRPSSSYGYAQATQSAWEDYKRSTGNRGADRDDFEDAVDFIGWYCHMSYVRCNISKTDPYRLYLAYHEGHLGYNKGTYKSKKDVQHIARQVEATSQRYERQLKDCPAPSSRIKSCLWPF